MRREQSEDKQSLVLVGAGHANILVIRRFAMKPIPGVRLVIVSPESTFPYSGMLPGFLAGQYTNSELLIDVASAAERAGARFIRGSLSSIDTSKKTIEIDRSEWLGGESTTPLRYDYACLNTGAVPVSSFPSKHPHCYYVKPIRELLGALPQIDTVMNQPGRRLVITGGGAAGVELAFAFRQRFGEAVEILIVAKHPFESDPGLKPAAGIIRRAFNEKKINKIEGSSIVKVDETGVIFTGGKHMTADVVCVATPVMPPDWIKRSGIATEAGFIKVDSHLRIFGVKDVFAVGDIISLPDPRPRSGVMAIRAGQYLTRALWSWLSGRYPASFKPQKNWLTLLNQGNGSAVASNYQLAVKGRWVFSLKDRIDRKFIDSFDSSTIRSDTSMRCEGCAAKIPGHVIENILDTAFEDATIDIESGGVRFRSVDALTYFIDDPYLMGYLSLRHAISDIWAMGGTPSSALALVGIERTGNPKLEHDEFQQCMQGIKAAANAYQIKISGGHSMSLDQPFVAMTVEGQADRSIRKKGVRCGDLICMSGPIGSGVLLAALKSGLPVGEAIDAWLRTAKCSLFKASQIAVSLDAHAMTDVTGFGLAGHLREMLDGSPFGFSWHDDIPVFRGVKECLDQGVISTSFQDNVRYAGKIGMGAPNSVVFDPQTCGPLIVSMPKSRSNILMRQWSALGLQPSLIGSVTTETS